VLRWTAAVMLGSQASESKLTVAQLPTLVFLLRACDARITRARRLTIPKKGRLIYYAAAAQFHRHHYRRSQ
jgi:hypothetical protein